VLTLLKQLDLLRKWAKSGLLEGADLKSEVERNNMAIILENQAKQLVQEASQTGTGTSITTGNSEAWAGVALPLVRRVFGEIVAKDLVSVQPMNLPSGLLFYLDFQYGSNTLNHTSGESIYGATADMTKTDLTLATDEVDGAGKGLYGAGRFGYSINSASQGTPTFTTAVSAAAEFSGILNYDTTFSASYAGEFGALASGVRVVQVNTSSLTDHDPEAVRVFVLHFHKVLTSHNLLEKEQVLLSLLFLLQLQLTQLLLLDMLLNQTTLTTEVILKIQSQLLLPQLRKFLRLTSK
jgi:hypothetical protein